MGDDVWEEAPEYRSQEEVEAIVQELSLQASEREAGLTEDPNAWASPLERRVELEEDPNAWASPWDRNVTQEELPDPNIEAIAKSNYEAIALTQAAADAGWEGNTPADDWVTVERRAAPIVAAGLNAVVPGAGYVYQGVVEETYRGSGRVPLALGGEGPMTMGNLLLPAVQAAAGIAQAVATGGKGGGGTLVGGTVTRAGGGLVFVRTTSGREVAIKRARRRHARYSRGSSMASTMKQIAMMNMMAKAMK